MPELEPPKQPSQPDADGNVAAPAPHSSANLEEPANHPYSRLSPDLVLSAAEAMGYETDARIFALNSYENRVYQVGLQDGRSIILKFYRPGRWSDEQILEEHEFTAQLADLEIPVAAPLQIGGQTMTNFEGFRIAVFDRLAGRAVDLENPDDLLSMGRFVGRLHAVGARDNFKVRPQLSVQRFGWDSRQFLLDSNFLEPEMRHAYETLSEDLLAKVERRFEDAGSLCPLRLHGDCHMGNVLWRDETPHFVDFDDTLGGPAIQDLWMMLSGSRDQQQAQLLELVEGYNEFFDFRPMELALIESLRTLRLMNYSAWLARRWSDPAFPLSFPWFNTPRYFSQHILELREQLAVLDEPPLRLI